MILLAVKNNNIYNRLEFHNDETKGKTMRAILTVIGKDRVGIIATVSQVLAKLNINILDINQTVLQEYFTMIMLVDYNSATASFQQIKLALNNLGKEIDMDIRIQREEIFDSMHKL